MELTPAVVNALIVASVQEWATSARHRFVQQPDALRANNYDAMNQMLFTFLDKLMAVYAV